MESQEDFGRLQQLLKLKRHEAPPPRYFEDFPARVLARLEREEAAAPQSIWKALGLDFNWQTAAGGFALLAVCVGGIWAGFGLGDPADSADHRAIAPSGLAGDASTLFSSEGSTARSLRRQPAAPEADTRFTAPTASSVTNTGANVEEFPNLRIVPAAYPRR